MLKLLKALILSTLWALNYTWKGVWRSFGAAQSKSFTCVSRCLSSAVSDRIILLYWIPSKCASPLLKYCNNTESIIILSWKKYTPPWQVTVTSPSCSYIMLQQRLKINELYPHSIYNWQVGGGGGWTVNLSTWGSKP